MSSILKLRLIPQVYLHIDDQYVVTGGGGAMGLEIARSVLETGGDVICADHAEEPLQAGWCEHFNQGVP